MGPGKAVCWMLSRPLHSGTISSSSLQVACGLRFCCCPLLLPQPQAALPARTEIPSWVPHLLQGSLDVDALSPGHGGVGQAVPGVAAAGDVDALPPQVLEGLGHHPHPVVRERRRVLQRERCVESGFPKEEENPGKIPLGNPALGATSKRLTYTFPQLECADRYWKVPCSLCYHRVIFGAGIFIFLIVHPYWTLPSDPALTPLPNWV